MSTRQLELTRFTEGTRKQEHEIKIKKFNYFSIIADQIFEHCSIKNRSMHTENGLIFCIAPQDVLIYPLTKAKNKYRYTLD
jgi:hypothetical protein